ncbi:uncharacterized protein LOC122863022 [Xyrichtys novacula]|uniref:Uncharacterized protein LOC122863022 n=1 Tax=Xyrichtys novacula TaxID=13765 RepID=A0AAV1GXG0_XYRNO|nr:uncharacterized protein LOC122863022 [Xyrichtys novacula]
MNFSQCLVIGPLCYRKLLEDREGSSSQQLSGKMDQKGPAVKRKKFYLHVSGKPSGAHLPMVNDLKRCGQREVSIPEDSDYILLFCVISSRVGTDVGEALENAPRGKEVILVVMHHTFDPDYITVESRRLVEDPNVVLVVDCYFHEGRLLQCDRNDIALYDIKKFLGVSDTVQSFLQISTIIAWLWKNMKWILIMSVLQICTVINWLWNKMKKVLISACVIAGLLFQKSFNWLRNLLWFHNRGRNAREAG